MGSGIIYLLAYIQYTQFPVLIIVRGEGGGVREERWGYCTIGQKRNDIYIPFLDVDTVMTTS
jgi:hypothetical protein